VLPPEAIFCDETVSNRPPFVNLLAFTSPSSYWSGKGGGLGFSAPGAIGMSLAGTRRPIVNGIGDGAFLYYPQALWTAASLKSGSIVFVVLNNTSYQILKLGVDRMGGPWTAGGAYPPGLDISEPRVDIAGLARSFGVEAETLREPSELRPGLERALAAGGPYLLDLHVERLTR
jgi:benzoylformate decarboxylase